MRLEYLAPHASLGEVVVLVGQWQSRGFHQRPGDGRAVAQVHRQFQVRRGEEGMLAGQAADPAGALRVQRQVLVPELLVAFAGDPVQAVATAVVEALPSADWQAAAPSSSASAAGLWQDR